MNMSRLGLDKNKYLQEMEAIDKYLSLETVDLINKDLGDKNYEDEYISFKGGYIGINSNATEEELAEYKNAVMKIVKQEPVIFLKTRIGLWKYMILHNSDVQKNLNIPIIALFLAAIYGFIKKRWAYLLISIGLLGNTAITLLLAPAAYFKYYYHIYLVGWLFITVALIYICEELLNRFDMNFKK